MVITSIGAQIIDFMILVVDITKGIQTQTAEVCVCILHRLLPQNAMGISLSYSKGLYYELTNVC